MKPNLRLATEPPERTPARAELAAAQKRHADAVRQLAANKTAQELTEQTRRDARDAIETATAAVEQAKVNAGQHLTAVAMGNAGPAPTSVKAARAALADVEDALEAAQAAGVALVEQEKDAEHELEYARTALDDRLRDVVRSEAPVGKLLAEAKVAQADLIAKRVRLRFLFNADLVAEDVVAEMRKFLLFENTLPVGRGQLEHGNFDKHPAADSYKRAIEALRTDADAPLPS
jgi:hypothetical protein